MYYIMKKDKQNLLKKTCILICFLITVNAFSKDSIIKVTELEDMLNIIDKEKKGTEPSSSSKKESELPVKTFRKFKSLEKFDTIPETKESDLNIENIKEGFQFNSDNASINEDVYNEAIAVFNKIDETANYIDELRSDELAGLPVAIVPTEINNVKYTVGIAKAVFTPLGTKLTAFLKVETPRTTSSSITTADGTTAIENREMNVLIFGAKDIMLSNTGGIIGEAKLSLISQFIISINSGKIILTLNGSFEDPKTYASIDCFGFKELALDANVKFSNDLIHPVKENGDPDVGYVESNFKVQANDWNDLVTSIDLPEFGIRGLKGFTFKLNTAVLDFSDLRNDSQMPTGYVGKYYGQNIELWRGLYAKDLQVILPPEFTKKNSDERISFTGTDMIIDGQGVTGIFSANNLFTIDEGSASKWKFSLDHIALDIETNAIKAGAFSGEIVLPVSEVDRLAYTAIIQPDDYTFQVSSTNEINFNVWNADVNLTEDSYIEMTVKNGEFRPKASLNGSLSIQSGLSKDTSDGDIINFNGIQFQNMVLQTESPKFSVDYFGYTGNLTIAGFPVSAEIALDASEENKANLLFDVAINLTSENDGGNGGRSIVNILGYLENDNGADRWKFDGIDLEHLYVSMDVAGIQLDGAIFLFENDEVYGDGFAGAIGAKFKTGIDLEIQAKALFGRTENFRYWFADVNASLPQGIPIFPGFEAKGFAGGFYNRMTMTGIDDSVNASFVEKGASTSGIIYEPEEQSGFGMKAMVKITTQNSDELFYATTEYGITFNRSGGLDEVYYKGYGKLISDLPSDFYADMGMLNNIVGVNQSTFQPNKNEKGISTDVFIFYDFTNDILHATSDVYVDYDILEGSGANKRAGWLDFYVGNGEWHLLVGTPDDPLGVKLDLGIVRMDSEAYFMTGNNIPGSPPPHYMVTQMLGIDASDLDYMRDFNSLESGKGFAFGTSWHMSTGDLRFLIFYASFKAGFGIDMMMKDYKEAHCVGSSDQLGLNGWYANGQAYAYVSGRVGLKIKVFGFSKKIDIFSASAGVLFQARLPNPTWMRGYLGGRYSVLGGAVKGSFNFKVELGEKCDIEGDSVLEGILIISDMTPEENALDVDVFAAPQVSFNMQINKAFEFQDDDGTHQYRIILDKLEVTKDDAPIQGKVEWNYGNDLATFYSHEILPPNSNLKAFVQLHFEEYLNGNWKVIKENGKISLDTKEVNFTTGTAPETIPRSNIDFMYPAIGQENFFIDEYNVGYISLKRGQSYLFDPVPSWDKTVILTSSTGETITENYGYDTSKRQITYSIPEEFKISTDYKAKLMLIPDEKADANSNVSESYTNTDLGDGDSENTVEIKSNKITETITQGQERELLDYEFGTSAYTTFNKKMNERNEKANLYDFTSYPYALVLSNRVESSEPFDLTELVGNAYTGNKPLVVARATMEDSYYKTKVYPLLYKEYPLAGQFTVSRKTDVVGIPPVEAIEPASWYLHYLEMNNENDIDIYHPYNYNLGHYYYADYKDLRNQLTSSDLNWEGMSEYYEFLTESFPLMKKGTYKSKLQYVLPGQFRNGGSDVVKYENPVYE